MLFAAIAVPIFGYANFARSARTLAGENGTNGKADLTHALGRNGTLDSPLTGGRMLCPRTVNRSGLEGGQPRSNMFSIGEFSKITGLTVKTLRFYHQRSVLVPARVESGSGYRYYDQRNVETARTIVVLKNLGFSLEQIIEILRDHTDDADLLTFLQRQKSQLKNRMARDRKIVSGINQIIQKETEAQHMAQQASFGIEVKQLSPQLVAGIRMKGRYEECGKAFGKLGRSLGRHIAGTPMCLFYDAEYRESDADFEPCMPVRKQLDIDGVDVRELPGGKAITLVHQGPYSQLGRSYEQLIRYAKEHGYEMHVPSREVYLKGPGMIFKGNPKNYLTEIQILVR